MLGGANMLVLVSSTFKSIFVLILLNVFLVLLEDFFLHRFGQIMR